MKRRRVRSILASLVLLVAAGCGDDCVVIYKVDAQTGLLIATGCGSLTVFVAPTPTPR